MTDEKKHDEEDKPKPGRPITRKIEIDATASEIAQSIFRAASKPDPSRRITGKSKVKEPA